MALIKVLSGLRKLVRSPAVASAAVFALGGVGFALGNLLLAGVLPHAEYGYVALFLSFTQLAAGVGGVGMETVVNRHLLGVSGWLLRRVLMTSILVGLVLAAVAQLFYDFGQQLSAVLVLVAVGAVLNRIAGALFQSRRKFRISLFLSQIHNWSLLVALPLVVVLDYRNAVLVAVVCALGYLVTASIGWAKARRQLQPSATVLNRKLVKEGLMVVGLQFAVSLFFQLDRFMIPKLLSINELATFAVAASLAGAPFRMLQVGAGYTLLPRLRTCENRLSVHRLLRQEGLAVAAIALLAVVAIVLLTPWIERYLLAGRYELSWTLITAMIVVGLVRVWNAFAAAAVNALGSPRHLMIINVTAWLAIGFAAVIAFAARSFGLPGIVYGVGAGWLLSAAAATWIARSALEFRHGPAEVNIAG